MSAAAASETSYVLGSDAIERARLERQHAIWLDAMLHSWDQAGCGAGQRLRDLGGQPGLRFGDRHGGRRPIVCG